MTIAPYTCMCEVRKDDDEFDEFAAVRFINAREKCSMRRREDDDTGDTDAISSSSRSRRMMVGSYLCEGL